MVLVNICEHASTALYFANAITFEITFVLRVASTSESTTGKQQYFFTKFHVFSINNDSDNDDNDVNNNDDGDGDV